MTNDGRVLVVILGALALVALARRRSPAPTFGYRDAAGALATVGPRSIVIANRTQQPPFQGGLISPSEMTCQCITYPCNC